MNDEEKERKEKVLHTRISESLDEEIREHASHLGVSVSNLVRNVLQNAFGLVGDIVADSSNIAHSARRASPPSPGVTVGPPPAPPPPAPPAPPAPPPAPSILGWQEALLNLNGVCDRCNAILPRGTRAAIALFEGAGPRTFRCQPCLAADLPPDQTPEQEPTDEP